jgi:FlaA1/EpsC-like NDP-sugar epimerase
MASKTASAALLRDGLEAAVTRRRESLFARDVDANRDRIAGALDGKRVLVIGGAGSIGAATTRLILDYGPAALHVVDQSENYLVELVRDLHGQNVDLARLDFRALPLDYGGDAMARLLSAEPAYNAVFNFAALKHVRSEKDLYSVLQLLDTNIVRHIRFKRWLAESGHSDGIYFAVSTDKAANPASVMGASKRLMEDLIFAYGVTPRSHVTAARFANVAFSNGSLLDGFAQRIAKRQPIAVPRDTRRYFVSHREAAEVCLLAAAVVPHRHVAIPHLDPASELQPLEDVAAHAMQALGFAVRPFDDPDEARAAVETCAASGEWPLVRTPLDTSGEKPYEEFVGQDEKAVACGLDMLMAIAHVPSQARQRDLFEQIEEFVEKPNSAIDREKLIALIGTAVANFHHVDTGRHLDQQL